MNFSAFGSLHAHISILNTASFQSLHPILLTLEYHIFALWTSVNQTIKTFRRNDQAIRDNFACKTLTLITWLCNYCCFTIMWLCTFCKIMARSNVLNCTYSGTELLNSYPPLSCTLCHMNTLHYHTQSLRDEHWSVKAKTSVQRQQN